MVQASSLLLRGRLEACTTTPNQPENCSRCLNQGRLPITRRIRQFSAGEAFALAAVVAALAIVVTALAVESRHNAIEQLRISSHTFARVTGIVSGGSGQHGWAAAHASWTDQDGHAHTVSFQADDNAHPVAGTVVEIVYTPDAPDLAQRASDVLNPSRFVAVICAILWTAVAGLCGYGVYARRVPLMPEKSNSPTTLFDSYIFAIDGQRLSIRGSKKMLAGLLLGIVFITVGVGMAYKMLTVPSSDWTPIGQKVGPMYPLSLHSIGDRIVTYASAILFPGCFVVAGCAAAVVSVRTMLRVWLFDKDLGVARVGKRKWPLGDIRALHLKVDTIMERPVGVSLMMELTTGKEVRVMRGMIGKNRTLADQQSALEPVARQMAEWLAVPLKFG